MDFLGDVHAPYGFASAALEHCLFGNGNAQGVEFLDYVMGAVPSPLDGFMEGSEKGRTIGLHAQADDVYLAPPKACAYFDAGQKTDVSPLRLGLGLGHA
jgi:hypothetical protein